jgi:hypothetical protein
MFRINLFVVVATVLLGYSTLLSAPKKVFILSGQSNMVGFGVPCSLSTTDIQNNGQFENVQVYSCVDNNTMLYGPQVLKAPLAGHSFFGPEMAIGEVLSNYYKNETIVFIKVAYSGSGLKRDWLGNPDLYPWFRNNVNTALGRIGEHKIEGMFWMQGEADGAMGEDTASEYGANLIEFVNNKIRVDFGNIPFVYGKIHNISNGNPWPFGEIVQEQQQEAENILGNAKFVPETGGQNATVYSSDTNSIYPCNLSGSEDCTYKMGCAQFHYNAQGQVYVGRSLGSAMVRLKNAALVPIMALLLD